MRHRAIALILPCLLASPVLAQTTQVAPVDQVQFQQQTISAQMQELQDRMFRLSETVRQMEPDDSAKLVLAVQRAREALIVEQMKEVIEKLGQRDLGKAADDQRQVLAKLEALKQLLLSSDLDLQAQLQQLRTLDAALKKIDEITKQQQAQRTDTAAQAKRPDAGKLPDLKQGQTATQQATQGVTQTVQSLGANAANATKSLGNAAGKMGNAAASLGGNKPGDAMPAQDGALQELADAKKELEAQREKILAELEKSVRKQVLVNLQEMLERQKSLREAETALASAAASGNRDAQLSVRRLALAEQRVVTINDQTLELIRQTDFSIALPPALEDIGRRCVYLQNDLDTGKTGRVVEEQSQAIEQDIASLIETFKQLAGSPKQSNCRGCKGNKNKLLAELKVLRLLQTRTNRETADADRERAKLAELPPSLRSKIENAYGHQNQAQAVADRIAAALAPDAPVN
ncbi:MAG: hypothetical protein QM754_09575 [Tepidisphaeraceae bacterium]